MASQGCLVCLAWIVCGIVPADASDHPREMQAVTRSVTDCGTLALYHLLSLNGRQVSLESIAAGLPVPTSQGHSLKDLKDAARGFGLNLDGRKLIQPSLGLEGPAIVHVRRDGRGHFLVVRPVGVSGRLVQVLDGWQPPRIVDWDKLVRSPGWTGFALAPSSGSAIPVLLGLAGGLSVAALVLRQVRASSGAPRKQNGPV